MHFIALHVNGSSNAIGITGNLDRLSMHPYFIFKDLITVFAFLLLFSFFVFFSPNTLGQVWPIIILYILLLQYAICWKYLILNYNKTNIISGLYLNIYFGGETKSFNLQLLKCYIKYYANPILVRYYYNKYNQQITKIIIYYSSILINIQLFIEILDLRRIINYILVGISETTSIQKILLNIFIYFNRLIEFSNNLKNNNSFKKYYSLLKNNSFSFKKNYLFNEWLAGLIDGDGCFGITQKKYTNCEITVGLEDEKMLRQIQNKFGGSIKLRSGSNSIRYRLHNKEGMIKLINAVNGNIRHSKRLVQLYKVCNLLNIEVINPIKLTKNNAWFIGFFDADGTINYYYQNNRPQLRISVTNKYLIDVQPYKDILGGTIYFDKSKNGYFKWTITNELNHLNFYNYNKNYSSKSFKGNKIFLIKEFYSFYNSKSYINTLDGVNINSTQPLKVISTRPLPPKGGRGQGNSLLYKHWLIFQNKWQSYNYKFK